MLICRKLTSGWIHWLLLLSIPVGLLNFQEPAHAESSLFESDRVMDIRLTGPLGAVQAETEQRKYQDFFLAVDGVSIPLKARLRGHSRVHVCEFPPLKLNFQKGANLGTAFDGQDKLKLVTHCRNHDRGEQDLLEEYLAYRIFSIMSEYSYRARLLRIEYVDSGGAMPDGASPRYGFVIESVEELARRLEAEPAELKGLPVAAHSLDQAALVYLFEYLIANTDYQLLRADREDYCCHNVDLLEKDSVVFMVPYDFDLSGLVNARYAYPDPMLRIKRVRQRLYRGLCVAPEHLRAALEITRERKAEILEIVAHTPGLSKENADSAEKYLLRFFESADEKDFLQSLEKHCLEGY